jgi:hypothetical protein
MKYIISLPRKLSNPLFPKFFLKKVCYMKEDDERSNAFEFSDLNEAIEQCKKCNYLSPRHERTWIVEEIE